MTTTAHVVVGLGPDTRVAVDRRCPNQVEVGSPSGVFDVVLFASSSAELRRLAAALADAADKVDLDAAEAEAHDINRGFELARALGMAPWIDVTAAGDETEVVDEAAHQATVFGHGNGRWTGRCSCGSTHGATDYEHIAAWRAAHHAANGATLEVVQ